MAEKVIRGLRAVLAGVPHLLETARAAQGTDCRVTWVDDTGEIKNRIEKLLHRYARTEKVGSITRLDNTASIFIQD